MISIMLVGCGNMGRAMLEGWLTSGRAMPAEVLVVEPVATLRAAAMALGVTAVAAPEDIDGHVTPSFIILAVKPQVVLDILPGFARFKRNCTYVSIVAGTPISALRKGLGNDAAIVRCMPNTPAAIGKGMTITLAGDCVDPSAMSRLHELLAANGAVTEIDDENLMDAVTAVSGSGPAYVFYFIECLQEAAVAAGLPVGTARLLAIQTVYGAAALAAESGDEPGNLRQRVTSPNGTTAAALEVLMADGALQALLTQAVDSARRRSIELRGPG